MQRHCRRHCQDEGGTTPPLASPFVPASKLVTRYGFRRCVCEASLPLYSVTCTDLEDTILPKPACLILPSKRNIFAMAWVRPKHPKRKEPVDPTDSLVPILQFFSGRPQRSTPKTVFRPRLLESPPPPPDLHKERSSRDHYEAPEHHTQREDYHDSVRVRPDYHERVTQRAMSQYTRDTSPPRSPPRPIRSKPRAPAINRHMPARQSFMADTSRVASSTWLSATTPLRI